MKKNLKKCIGVLLLTMALLCIVYIIRYKVEKSQNAVIYTRLQRQVFDEQKYIYMGEDYISPIDFNKLWEVNEDIYAWITIPDTQINYPIVQSPDDDGYYLNHTIDGQEGYPGSIYTESCNSKDFTDYNTVIYGHNMKDGSMFQGLHDYEDDQYLKDHPYIEIYTPDKEYKYQIFAVVVYSNVHILKGYDFSKTEQRQMFLDSVYSSRSMENSFDLSVNVDTDSKILTLSTCIGGRPESRLLVEAVLIDE